MSTKATTLNSKKSVGALVKDWMSLVGIAILIVVFSIISYVKFGAQYFLTWSNWKNILLQSSTVAIVALGQSIMLLTGNFDLSLGRMVCLTSCVGAILMKNVGMSTGLAILIMFAIGLAVGAVNGFMVSYVGVPAMIATLGTWYITKGLAYAISNSYAIVQGLPANFGWVNRYIGPFPLMVVIAVAVFAVFYILLNRTLLGKYAYAIGGNSETARLSGIKVNLVRCVLYILTALMSSFVGILMSSRINSGDPNLSTSGIEFEIIVAIILGGTSLLGGQGSLIGTLIGALILGNLSNGMNLLGIGTVYQFIVEGAVLVVAVVLDLTLKGNGLRIKKLRRSN